jgi:hypothetical protein
MVHFTLTPTVAMPAPTQKLSVILLANVNKLFNTSNVIIDKTRKPSIFGSGYFLFVTTCEKKNGLLLIEVFEKLINPQIEGQLDHLQVAFTVYQGF